MSFFNQTNCDRCNENLSKFNIRTTSWFTEETICKTCSSKEKDIRNKLPGMGKDYEGCGYLPK